MKKVNNKGFMLIETLLVTTFVAGVLIYMFIQFSNLSTNYENSYKYNTVDNLYALEDVKEYIKSDSFAVQDLKSNMADNPILDITDCSIFTSKNYCLKLLELENINKVLVSTNDINPSNDYTRYNEGFGDFIKKIKPEGDEEFRLLVEFKNDTYATLRFDIKEGMGYDFKINDESITNYTDGNIHEMYTFNHEATDQTSALKDYRYIGSDPYNYVTFNNETWRIIGIFPVEDSTGNTSERIKIVKDSSIGSYAWASNSINEWKDSSLQTYLNVTYYNSLSAAAKSMISDAKYYLGGADGGSFTAQNCYNFERGTVVSEDNSKNWIGKIGIIYPSDYLYVFANGVDNTCYTNGSCSNRSNGWLFNGTEERWLITPNPAYNYRAFITLTSGKIGNAYNISNSRHIYPTLYLSSNVKIDKGTGQMDNPYTLRIG